MIYNNISYIIFTHNYPTPYYCTAACITYNAVILQVDPKQRKTYRQTFANIRNRQYPCHDGWHYHISSTSHQTHQR